MPFQSKPAFSLRREGRLITASRMYRIFALVFPLLLIWAALSPQASAAASTDSANAVGDSESSSATTLYSHSLYDRLRSGERVDVPGNKSASLPSEKQPIVYLTFDDGPDKLTPQVLDILKQADVKATFFMVGEWITRYPDIAKRVVKEGHALGNHSYNHVYSQLYSSYGTFIDQIDKTGDAFEKAVGFRPQLLRAPGGTSTNFDAFYYYLVDLACYRTFDWNVDSGDATRRGVPAKEIIANVKKAKLTDSMVVLMHDGAGHGETVKALPEIIRYFKEKGYAFSAITDQVKPVQFRLAKSKWNRAMTYDSFVNYAKTALDTRINSQPLANETISLPEEAAVSVTPGAEPSPSSDTINGKEASNTTALLKPVGKGPGTVPDSADKTSLTLKIDHRDWVLNAGEYDQTDGRISVPLEELAGKLGGTLIWNGGDRAFVRLGIQMVEYNLKERSVYIYDPIKGDSKRPLVRMMLIDGKLWVALRLAVDILGGNITAYSQKDGRVMSVDIQAPRQALIFHVNLPRTGV
ncbi:polysaccharide deacetylase [Gorillibacterium massiliense]|uniref:polysaccharide deacetylase n=1 Tax=Gorillibacterium massiliense TaxID=1280390 RepID=UPI0004B61F9A|nr:polysaccharide deacetylase [Gorillibacterium massiliense]